MGTASISVEGRDFILQNHKHILYGGEAYWFHHLSSVQFPPPVLHPRIPKSIPLLSLLTHWCALLHNPVGYQQNQIHLLFHLTGCNPASLKINGDSGVGFNRHVDCG